MDLSAWRGHRIEDYNRSPARWPIEAMLLLETDDVERRLTGLLLISQWEHRLAGHDMARHPPGSPIWIAASDTQRAAYHAIAKLREELDALRREAPPAEEGPGAAAPHSP